MSKPQMFKEKLLKNFNVWVIKHKETGELFQCDFTPKFYYVKDSADYTIQFMHIPEYESFEVEYNPNENTFE